MMLLISTAIAVVIIRIMSVLLLFCLQCLTQLVCHREEYSAFNIPNPATQRVFLAQKIGFNISKPAIPEGFPREFFGDLTSDGHRKLAI